MGATNVENDSNIFKILELLKEERSFPNQIEDKFIAQLLYEIEVLKLRILSTLHTMN